MTWAPGQLTPGSVVVATYLGRRFSAAAITSSGSVMVDQAGTQIS